MPTNNDFPTTSASLLAELKRPVANERAWLLFAQRYRPPLVAWCRKMGLQEADAEDVTQWILLKVARALQTYHYKPEHLFRGWLKTVARRAVYDFWRKRAQEAGRGTGDPLAYEFLRQLPAEDDDTFRDLEQPIQDDYRVALEAIRHVQARVKEQTWQAFWLTCIEDASVAEVAQRLGLKRASVYQAKHRIPEMLRQAAEGIRQNQGGHLPERE
jgi:RNA polymerase sigma-70 factor (ECF subfamily)